MSFHAMAWAVKQRVERPADKLVLLGLADRYNADHGVAFPSVGWLCEFSGLDRKTINNAMRRLKTLGLISEAAKRIGNTGRVKAYALALTNGDVIGPETDLLEEGVIGPKVVLFNRGNRSVFPHQYVQKRTTKPIKEPVKDANASLVSETPKKIDAVLPDWLPQNTWADYIDMRRAIKAPLTPKAQVLAIAKLDALMRAGHSPGAVLEQSILNSWRGLFELKGHKHERSGSPLQRGRNSALDILAELDALEAGGDDADHRGTGFALSGGWG